MEAKKSPASKEAALASQEFDLLCAATTQKSILGHHRQLCELLRLKPSVFPQFYPRLKSKLVSWKAKALWAKFDKRASHKCYNRGKACPNTKVLIIGAGPCGLRTAIEAQLLGAKVVVVEKRDRISRHNVLHLWPFVIHDLKALNAKKFFGKFCAGAIDHISIRQLQCILLKVALILGVEFHEGVSFEELIPPPDDQSVEKTGWRAKVLPADHPVSQYEFDVLIGADGKRNTLAGFKRKEFRGKLAIAITANFINRHTEAEARVEEISGVAFIFNQKFFKDLYEETGIDLENIVYYKDETHYFVMTAKKHSLISNGVILNDYPDTVKLLAPDNKDPAALMKYARDAAEFSTNYIMQNLEFAVDHYGQPDVAMFDFTSMFAAENASRCVERHGYKLLQMLVGDGLLEPFWPTGSGCARGFLSSMDACWAVRNWASGAVNVLDVLAERESIYRILGQTTPENLQRDYAAYTLDPHTRYPNLNKQSVNPIQVKQLFDTDDPAGVEIPLTIAQQDVPKKRRRKDSQVHPDTLLHWLKKQVALYDRATVSVENVTSSFKNGLALCAIIHRYRPDLLDFHLLKPEDVAKNNQLAFDILERELAVPPVMTGLEMELCDIPDKLTMLSYLSQIYDTFRGEIPHIKHPKLEPEIKEEDPAQAMNVRLRNLKPEHKVSLLGRLTGHQPRVTPSRKRASADREERTPSQKLGTAEKRVDSALRRPRKRRSQEKIGATQDREARMQEEIRRGGLADENISDRAKMLEDKFRGRGPATDKKPKDLFRAIGKIEKSDWNVKEIEKKIQENKMGRGKRQEKGEKVPKWSREQFDDKFEAMKTKLQRKSLDKEKDKYADIDVSLKRLDRKIKEGSVLDMGQRGSNKVSALAEQLAYKTQEPEKPTIQKSSSKAALVLPSQGGSEICHFCNKRVYLMERSSAEGKFFHRGCFRCEYCSTTLRLGNYAFDREGKHGSRFFCMQHSSQQTQFGNQPNKARRKSEELRIELGKENIPNKTKVPPFKSTDKTRSRSLLAAPALTKVVSDSVDTGRSKEPTRSQPSEDDDDDAHNEMDEDEWTDVNFGNSTAEGSGDSASDASDEEPDEVFEEPLEEPMNAAETRLLAETWTKRYSGGTRNGDVPEKPATEEEEEEESESYEDDGSDEDGSQVGSEYDTDEDESDTQTEGEEEIKARERRKMEVPREQRPTTGRNSDTGSDTELVSDESSESESEEENSATEISTDSEFEHDGTTPTQHEIPEILIDDSNVTRRRVNEEPKKVQVRTGQVIRPINGTVGRPPARPGVKLEFKPLRLENEAMKSSSLSNLPMGINNINNNNTKLTTVVVPTPLINPRRGDYLLNRTLSTEGIASKLSLELKKKYLLGPSGLSGSVKKSGSASTLDSAFKSVVDVISEQQKLLKPAAELSPSMQAFLQGTSQVRPYVLPANPLSPSLSTILNSPSPQQLKDLTLIEDPFEHVCALRHKDDGSVRSDDTDVDVDKHSRASAAPISQIVSLPVTVANGVGVQTLNVEEPDCRPRSPAHETSIVVPDIPWKVNREDDEMDSDSLSSDDSDETGDEEDGAQSRTPSPPMVRERTPPRVEIHNTCGEVIESGVVEPMKQMPVKPTSIDLFGTKQQPGPASERSSPSSPPSTRGEGSESLNNEATLALTETEWSDWAQDGDAGVSDDLEDVEYNINPQFVTQRRHKKVKTKRGGNAPAKMAPCEDFNDFDDFPQHVCGKIEDKVEEPSALGVPRFLANSIDNIEFMDTCEEDDSGTEDFLAATNKTLLANSGYVQFINTDDEDMETPIVETPKLPHLSPPVLFLSEVGETSDTPDLLSLEVAPKSLPMVYSDHDDESYLQPEGATTDDTTTSDLITVKDSPMDNCDNSLEEKFFTPSKDSPGADPTGASYEEYVKRLQGRMSPFSNARDSIDIRKSRKPVSKVCPGDAICEEKSFPEDQQIQPETTGISQKLQEISRDRSKQKDLVHEMVMGKITGRRSQERKGKRSITRNILSPQTPLCNHLQSTASAGDTSSPHELPVIKSYNDQPKSLPNVVNPMQDLTPTNETKEEFHTPLTSFKKTAEVRNTPLGPQSSFRGQRPAKLFAKAALLPDTPLTNPEAFSCPDITHALEMDAFKTPVAPPRSRDEVQRTTDREQARLRARLKSDEELGLSPEDYIKSLKQRVLNRSSSRSEPIEPLRTLNITPNPAIFLQNTTSNPLFVDSDGVGDKRASGMLDESMTCTHNQSAPGSPESAPAYFSPPDRKKAKEPERRKSSIIQAVSDFFHKKKESPRSASPPRNSDSKPKDKLSRFKFTPKSRDRSKQETKGKGVSAAATSKSLDHLDMRSMLVNPMPPPIPPPPVNYLSNGAIPRLSEDSSEAEDDSRFTAMSTPTHGASSADANSSNKRHSRMNHRMARQVQLKRLRMAQEIQRQLEELEVKQRELERRGVSVEKALRGEGADVDEDKQGEEETLLREWFELMRERSDLRRYEQELMLRAEELQLEDRHARLQQELRDEMSKDDANKSSEDVMKEGQILAEMLDIVERKDSIVRRLDEDRLRYLKEDEDIEAQMVAKGLRLRQESHV